MLSVLIPILLCALNTNRQYVAQEAVVPACGNSGEFRYTAVFLKVPNIHAASVCKDIVFTPITIHLSLHPSTSVPTTHYAGTQRKFAGLPGTTTDTTGGFTAITDQSSSTYFSKQAARVGGHAFVSDGCGEVDESADNLSDSKDDIPLQKYTQR